jgi:ATP-binding cassette subfamily B protein
MADQPYRTAASVFRSLLKMLALDRKDISAVYMFTILAGLLQLSLPLGIQTIIGFVLAGSLSASIIVLIAMVVLGTVINGLLQVRQLQLIEKLKQKIFTRYALGFAERLPRLNLEKLDNRYLPEMVNRFFEIPSLQKGIEKLLLEIPAAIIQILLGLVLLSFYHPIFIAFGAVLLVIVLLIIRFTLEPGFTASLESSEYKYGVAAWLQEMSRMIKSFKFASNSHIHMEKTDELTSGYLASRTKYFRILLTQAWSFIAFKTLITAAMLIMGAVLLVDQQINIGQFIAADIVIITIISSVEKLISNLDKIYDSFTSIEKMNVIAEAETEPDGTLVPSETGRGVTVTASQLHFAYAGHEPVLQEVNLSVDAGELVLLQGASGSGKSTLLRLLGGAYRDFEGELLIDGLPIRNYRKDALRNQTGVLLDQQDIFQASLEENIVLGDHKITTERISRISRITGLDAFIAGTRDGLDTILDPLGKRLTQRVRQQILLTRALVTNSRLILLEEPFRHLSTEERSRILQYLREETHATVIIVSGMDEKTEGYTRVIRLNHGKTE